MGLPTAPHLAPMATLFSTPSQIPARFAPLIWLTMVHYRTNEYCSGLMNKMVIQML